jgi:hypothetical protein
LKNGPICVIIVHMHFLRMQCGGGSEQLLPYLGSEQLLIRNESTHEQHAKRLQMEVLNRYTYRGIL